MNDATRIVADWLDQQHPDSYVPSLEEFSGLIVEALTDCGSDVWRGSLIVIALRDVDWGLLHGREFRRHIKSQREAEKTQKEMERLGDIPF